MNNGFTSQNTLKTAQNLARFFENNTSAHSVKSVPGFMKKKHRRLGKHCSRHVEACQKTSLRYNSMSYILTSFSHTCNMIQDDIGWKFAYWSSLNDNICCFLSKSAGGSSFLAATQDAVLVSCRQHGLSPRFRTVALDGWSRRSKIREGGKRVIGHQGKPLNIG